MSNRLLLADGDAKSLRVLEVSLRSAGFQVSTAESGTAAWDAVQREGPAVIIADPDLPELDGLALCARVRERAVDRGVPFIFLGADKSVEARVRGLQAGADEYLVKPTYVNEVISRVRALIQRRERDKVTSGDAPAESFQGQLRDITVVDLLEIVAANRRSGIIHLHGPRGATAAVYFRQGVVIDAEVGRLSGADAIERLFAWSEGTFDVEWKSIRRPDAIGRPTADLVLEGLKRLDQKTRVAADNGAGDGVYEVNYRVLADRLAEIPDEVNGILRLLDGSRRLAQVVEDAQIPDAEAMSVIARLRDEGIIIEVKPKVAEAPREAVPAAALGDSGSGRNGATGGERPSGRVAAAVGQSFADRMRAGAGARVGAERSEPGRSEPLADSEPPPPPPGTTKTDRGFPQLDLLSAPSTGPDHGDPPRGPSRGEANLELLNAGDTEVPDEVPPSRAADDNVIPFPTEERGSSPRRDVVETSADEDPPATSDEMTPEELAALFGTTTSTEPASESGASSGESAAPKVPASMLQTQRGFGLAPPPPPGAAAEPESPPGDVAPPLSSSLEGSVPPAEPAPDAAARELAATAGDVPASQDRATPAARPRTATGGGGVVTLSTVGEATAQYADRDLSKGEALDELGVPGRHRTLKVVAAALVLGALGAVGMYRFRAHHPTDSVEMKAAADMRGASPAPSPETPRAAESPPAVAPPSAGEHEKSAATVVEKTAERPAGAAMEKASARAEKGTETAPTKAPEKVGEKKPSEARGATDAEKPPAPDAFRQQLAECHALFSKNRFREASTACGAAVQSNPRSAEALTMLAHVELNRGHMSRAYDLAQKAISIYPDQPDAYVIIGGVHQDGGRNQQAKAAYQRYLHLAPHGRYAVELRSIVGSL